jgi:hypothetical protein
LLFFVVFYFGVLLVFIFLVFLLNDGFGRFLLLNAFLVFVVLLEFDFATRGERLFSWIGLFFIHE